MKLYNAIDPSRMHGIPSIGVNMHIEGTEEWEDEQADIVSGKRIDVDFLNYTPELRDTPKVQDAIKKLIAAYPEKDVIDMETKEQKIQTLAAELDQLSYDIDTFEYRDSVPDREAQVQMIANDIRSGNVKPLQIFLQTSIDEGIDADSERQAKELLAKLAEYKPLAKIEEIEEQNYNMIDDRLNNGVEKFNREEEKKEQQEKPQARSSLKERLAAKQTEVAQGKKDSKEQDKAKKRTERRYRNMNNLFTVEETNLICIFQSDSRAKVIEGIHKAMKHIDDDALLELSMRVAGKLESIGDEEYAGLVLEAAIPFSPR